MDCCLGLEWEGEGRSSASFTASWSRMVLQRRRNCFCGLAAIGQFVLYQDGQRRAIMMGKSGCGGIATKGKDRGRPLWVSSGVQAPLQVCPGPSTGRRSSGPMQGLLTFSPSLSL